jgi:hypothetical protein
VGQPEDLVSVLALLSLAVGNFCRRDRDFRESGGREHQFRSRDFVSLGRDCRHPRAIALTKRVAPVDKLSIILVEASAPHFWARDSGELVHHRLMVRRAAVDCQLKNHRRDKRPN